ncbi:replication initiator [Planomonospora sp. ID82291]|uniref:replication initiator n=1 Tax=Planomonospora sp. ID82291 TaxID=2738136 RepID=UPI0018C3DE67|nr:replication initiator [Planomonospora sp. ID82291]MBG0814658.1 replication initiation protein [Planomonospora sp. ID82291]
MPDASDRNLPRLVRGSLPLALDVAVEVAKLNGVCIRPIEMRRLDTLTGKSEPFDIPCGATQEAKCPPCAKRNKQLRKAQCREGWHLDAEPISEPNPSTEEQRWLIEFRADVQAKRDAAERDGEEVADWDEAIQAVDAEINAAGMRGNVLGGRTVPKRSRSTRRRQDAPDLPKRARENTTLGRTFIDQGGRVYRPSMFITLTLPSYGRIWSGQGVPADPANYDYARAARDALHFSKLVDRFVQNLRRVAGYDVQYFATVEPQKRLAPHLHMAIRGTLPRAEIKQIAAATYHQVWWPAVDEVRFEGDHLPVWTPRADLGDGTVYPDGQSGDYLDPETGELLPTWDDALDQLDQDDDAEPLHVLRFGSQVDVQGVLAGTPDADQCIRYLSKYLTKSLGDTLDPDEPGYKARRDHAARMVEALRYEPCSPTCPNWLRYGVQPKGAKAGMAPGRCRGKAHKPEHLGYAGRRVLVSRKWSNKTLREHKADRRAWVLDMLGLADDSAENDPHRYIWRPVSTKDPTRTPLALRLLRGVADRQRTRARLLELQARAEGKPIGDLSAIGEAA